MGAGLLAAGLLGWLALGPATQIAAAQTAAAQQAATPTRTTLTVASAGAETVFTAHVTDTTGTVLKPDAEASSETGADGQVSGAAATVSFETGSVSGPQALGAAVVDKNGDARLTVTSLPTGADGARLAVQAIYHPAVEADGSSHTAASVSPVAMVQADASAAPDFTVTANPATLTVSPGQFANSVLTVTPLNGFNEQVTLSCSNLPAQATCSFSPVIASTASGAFTSTLQVQTQAPSGALAPPGFGRRSGISLAWLLPGGLALVGLASVRRRLRRSRLTGATAGNASGNISGNRSGIGNGLALLLLAGGLAGIVGLSGCNARYGYEHHPPTVATGTLPGTYSINIAASGNSGSSVTVHNLTLTLQVQ